MKKTLLILTLGALPALAVATGEHSANHDTEDHSTEGHDMKTHDMEGHNMGSHQAKQGHGTRTEHDHKQHVPASAAGKAGDPNEVSRTIEINMDDSMRFTPSRISIKAGETIRFSVKNTGKVSHEMVIGEMNVLKAHAEMMRRMPGMKHAEANMITLAPGQQGGIVWQFTKAGMLDFACLIPGHMEAGMLGKIEVR